MCVVKENLWHCGSFNKILVIDIAVSGSYCENESKTRAYFTMSDVHAICDAPNCSRKIITSLFLKLCNEPVFLTC